MNKESFFENLEHLFEDDDLQEVDIPATIYRDKEGKVTEIRIFNKEFDDILIVDRRGNVETINVDEYKE